MEVVLVTLLDLGLCSRTRFEGKSEVNDCFNKAKFYPHKEPANHVGHQLEGQKPSKASLKISQ